MKFKVPMKWDLSTIEEVEADTPHEAESKARIEIDTPRADPSTWKVEKRIDGVNWQKMEEMYPTPEPPDPMEGWECLMEPGAYEGGLWNIRVGDYEVRLIGDDGPIEVGMGITTYTWKISSILLPYDLESKESYHDRDKCRDDALEAVKSLN